MNKRKAEKVTEEVLTNKEPAKVELIKGESSQLLTAFKFSSWSEAVDLISKTILVVFGSAYILGLLILNFHIRKYGISYLGFLQIEYVMVGILWAFLVGVIYSFFFYLSNQIRAIFQAGKKQQRRIWRVLRKALKLLFELVAAFGVLFYILGAMSDGELGWFASAKAGPFGLSNWIVIGVLALNAGGLFNLSEKIKNITKRFILSQDAKEDKTLRIAFYFDMFNHIVVSIVLHSLQTKTLSA